MPLGGKVQNEDSHPGLSDGKARPVPTPLGTACLGQPASPPSSDVILHPPPQPKQAQTEAVTASRL